MITLQDFIDLSMDDFYKINIYDIEQNKMILEQIEVGEIAEQLNYNYDILEKNIASWDIDENSKQFTINL